MLMYSFLVFFLNQNYSSKIKREWWNHQIIKSKNNCDRVTNPVTAHDQKVVTGSFKFYDHDRKWWPDHLNFQIMIQKGWPDHLGILDHDRKRWPDHMNFLDHDTIRWPDHLGFLDHDPTSVTDPDQQPTALFIMLFQKANHLLQLAFKDGHFHWDQNLQI